MYLHTAFYDVKYTDADFEDKIKISSLLCFLEESACLSADELGFGYSVLQPKNLGFVLVNWYLKFFRTIKLGDRLRVETWPIKPGKIITFRDFRIFCGEELVAVATSRWGLVDLNSFVPIALSGVFDPDARYNDFRSVEINNIKVAKIESGELAYTRTVRYSDCDHYMHANNTKYADFVFDAFSLDEMKGKQFDEIKITYSKQTKAGEELSFFRQQIERGYVVEARACGETRLQLQVTFNE